MGTPNVMIVGEREGLGQSLSRDLATLGYCCCGIANNLRSSVRIGNTFLVDAAIVDLTNGRDLEQLAIANTLRKSFNTPVIYLTQILDPLIMDQLATGPAIGFILAPYTRQKLGSALENLLDLESERSLPWTATLGRLNLVPPEQLGSGLPASRRFGHL